MGAINTAKETWTEAADLFNTILEYAQKNGISQTMLVALICGATVISITQYTVPQWFSKLINFVKNNIKKPDSNDDQPINTETVQESTDDEISESNSNDDQIDNSINLQQTFSPEMSNSEDEDQQDSLKELPENVTPHQSAGYDMNIINSPMGFLVKGGSVKIGNNAIITGSTVDKDKK